jgi:hypothetical protein
MVNYHRASFVHLLLALPIWLAAIGWVSKARHQFPASQASVSGRVMFLRKSCKMMEDPPVRRPDCQWLPKAWPIANVGCAQGQ